MRIGDEAFVRALGRADRAPDLRKAQEEELVIGEAQGRQRLLSPVLLRPVLVGLGTEKTKLRGSHDTGANRVTMGGPPWEVSGSSTLLGQGLIWVSLGPPSAWRVFFTSAHSLGL